MSNLEKVTRCSKPKSNPQLPFSRPHLSASNPGDLTFNPEKDTLIGADGKEVMLSPPSGDELPSRGFDAGARGCCRGIYLGAHALS